MYPKAPLILVLWLVACGCERELVGLSVGLVTDYVPGEEFTDVRTVIEGTEYQTPVSDGDSFAPEARRVVDVGNLPASATRRILVELIAPDGAVLASRTAAFDNRGSVSGSVVIARDCGGVQCTEPSQTCVAGQCRDERCLVSSHPACGEAECTADRDCPVPMADCASAVCVSGTCLDVTGSPCSAAEYCHPDRGCEVRSVEDDAGPGGDVAECGGSLLEGTWGEDDLVGCDGRDVMRGEPTVDPGGTVGGDDCLYGGGGNDTIGGKAGNDVLFGGDGEDWLVGDGGEDILYGGPGADELSGDDRHSSHPDVFVLEAREPDVDVITDFEPDSDRIVMLGTTVTSLTLAPHADGVGVFLDGALRVVLRNARYGSVDLTRFRFAEPMTRCEPESIVIAGACACAVSSDAGDP